ncbi:MAG TPA: hypothetical protein VK171_06990, partial [Fimbriimonas sp.]|nr:hypothetical protein [Fimbriimonas sp.]
MLVLCCTLLTNLGVGVQPPTLTLEYKTLEKKEGISTNGTAKIQLKGNEIFGELNRPNSRAFWSYDGQFSHEYLKGAQASSRIGFSCFQIGSGITFATNEYGPKYVLGPEKYHEFLKSIDKKRMPKAVIALLKNPGNFNATLP